MRDANLQQRLDSATGEVRVEVRRHTPDPHTNDRHWWASTQQDAGYAVVVLDGGRQIWTHAILWGTDYHPDNQLSADAMTACRMEAHIVAQDLRDEIVEHLA